MDNIDILPDFIKGMFVQTQNFEQEVPSPLVTLNKGNSDVTEVSGCVEDNGDSNDIVSVVSFIQVSSDDHSKCSDDRTKREVVNSRNTILMMLERDNYWIVL